MIAVETVIRKLVSEYEFVILPGFGALLSHQVPAIYDQDSGIFAPPVKKLAFNEFLKLDDGLLADFISREEKISHLEAVSYVRQYTDILRSSLKSEGKTKIDGVGEFEMNVEGKLIFEPNTEKYFKDEWYGFKSISAKTFEINIDSKIPVLESHIVTDDHVKIVDFIQESKKLNFNWTRWASAALIAGIMFYVSFFLVSVNKESIKSNLNPFANLFEQKAAVKQKVNKPEILKPASVQINDNTINSSEKIIEAVNTEVPNETVAVNVPEVKNEIVIKETNKDFYLIAGAFKGMKQANVLLVEMKSKGYDKAIIIPSDKYSKKVKVAVEGYASEQEAYSASAQLKRIIGEDGWVYKRR